MVLIAITFNGLLSMSHWNHRILAKTYQEEVYLQMYEVYYDKDGKPDGYTANPVTIGSETLKGIKWTLARMKEATKKPILWADEGKFPQEYEPEK